MSRDRKTANGWLRHTEQYITALEYVVVHIFKI